MAHVLTHPGQFHQRPTAFVASEFGWTSLAAALVDGLVARHGIAIAVTPRTSRPQEAVLLPTRSQSALQNKLVLVSRQALLENMGFHPGKNWTCGDGDILGTGIGELTRRVAFLSQEPVGRSGKHEVHWMIWESLLSVPFSALELLVRQQEGRVWPVTNLLQSSTKVLFWAPCGHRAVSKWVSV